MGSSLSKYMVSDPTTFATPIEGLNLDLSEAHDWKSFDYVVVGGGTAGCVLASRLSEDPNNSVLLVEAGKSHENYFLSRLPTGSPKLWKGSSDWGYSTIPQATLDGRSVDWPRGKLLGGTSSVNAVIYHHCAPEDFDAWVEQGATGWGYETMKRYFHKAEKYNPRASSLIDASLRGNNGLLNTSQPDLAPISTEILKAAEKIGIQPTVDFNTPQGTLGASAFVGCIDKKHQRSSTAAAYMDEGVLQRPNLTVAVETTTERILFQKIGDDLPKAVGIQISMKRLGPQYGIRATKEVIVCAGAIGTPQLLMLSGIGPATHLTDLNIPLIQDIPSVGENLLDHFHAGAAILRAKPGTTLDYLQSPLSAAKALARWMLFGTGPMTSLSGQVGMFIRSDDANLPFGVAGRPPLKTTNRSSGPGAPDVEIATSPLTIIDSGSIPPAPGVSGITFLAILLKPNSAGTVRLQTASIWDKPLIDANYLAAENDLMILLKSVRLILRLARTEPLASSLDLGHPSGKDDFGPYWLSDVDPDTVSDEDLTTWIKKHGQTAWHPTSTVKMGQSRTTSAVDTELRVHGVQGLRVVDASVFPDQVSGHPCAVVVALAERAADMIKGIH